MVAAINWDVDSQLIDGYNTPNLYGLLFVTGLIIGYFVVRKMFRKDGISDEMLDKLVLFMVVATIVGARLGHVFFYGPYWDEVSADGVVLERGYFSHPGDILKVWEGGLASHGAAPGGPGAGPPQAARAQSQPRPPDPDRRAVPGRP